MSNQHIEPLISEPMLFDYVLEARNVMSLKDRLTYIDVVTEALNNTNINSGMLNALYNDLSKIDQLGMSEITSSKGRLTKFRYYPQLSTTIDTVKELNGDEQTPNIVLLTKLHRFLLDCAADFSYGFNTNNMIIMSTYKTSVAALYSLTEMCVVDATAALRVKLGVKTANGKVIDKKNSIILKSVTNIVKLYESGSWSSIMKIFRANTKEMEIATEGVIKDFIEDVSFLKSQGKAVVSAIPPEVTDKAKSVGSTLGKIFWGKGAKVLYALVALLFAIRGLIFVFFKMAFSINTSIKTEAEILKANIENNPNAPGIEKQKKQLNNMEKISDFITYKIFKADREAQKDLDTRNVEELSSSNITTNVGEFDII